MKKIFFMVLISVALLTCDILYAQSELFEVRNKIFQESQEIKPLITSSKDVVILNSIWDTCIMTVTQLDAYFSMQGIFDTIKKEDINKIALDYLINWLEILKNTNSANIKNLLTMSNLIEEGSRVHIKRLRGYFDRINDLVTKDIAKLSEIRKALKKS